MSKHVRHQAQLGPVAGYDPGAVAAAAAEILADAECAIGKTRAEVEPAAADLPARAGDDAISMLSQDAAERLRDDMEAKLSADHATIAEISRDLASLHSRLDQISQGVIALQTHSLRQTGGVALALSVLIAIAWKVIGG